MTKKEEKIDALAKLSNLLYDVQGQLSEVKHLALELGYRDIYQSSLEHERIYEKYEWRVNDHYEEACE